MAKDNNSCALRHEASADRLIVTPETFYPVIHGLSSEFSLTQFAKFSIRSLKVPQDTVDKFLECFRHEKTDLIPQYPLTPKPTINIGPGMNAAIVPVGKGNFSLVQTIDYVYPVIDDPFYMGKIACSDVLSDLYATGVTDCDNILMLLTASTKMTDKERDAVLPLIIKGFKETATEASTEVRGGQTAINPWCSIGGVATAVCRPHELIPLNGVKVGDVIVLTKPLGTHVAINAYRWMNNEIKWNKLKFSISEEDVRKAYWRAVDSMCRLNRVAATLMHKYHAHGATDVTGYGLLGHATALAKNQNNKVSLVIHNLPVIAKMDLVAKECNDIFRLFQGHSPETSGGLLICLARESAAEYCKEFGKIEGHDAWVIGQVVSGPRTAQIIEKPRVIQVPLKHKEGNLW